MPPQALSPPSAAVGAPNFHMFHPKDRGKMALVGLFMVSLAHARRKQMRRRWLNASQQVDAEQHTQSLLRQFADHPASAYLLDNGAVLGLTYCILRFLPRPQQGRPVYSLMCSLLATLLAEPLILFEKFCAAVLYPHVPYFSDNPLTAPSHDWWTMLTEFVQCNCMASLVGNAAGVVAFEMMPAAEFDRIVTNPKPMCFVPYLAKFLFCRVVTDIVFHVVHRAMHHYPAVYNAVHKRHHEHTTPQIPTNYHFNWIDILIEGGLPYGSAMFALKLVWGHDLTYVEQTAILTPLSYFASGSHTGKEIPTVSWFPVLSPLVDMLTGCDQRLVEYHTRHHQLFRCNYSISPWPDKLMGTYRIDLPESYGGNKEE